MDGIFYIGIVLSIILFFKVWIACNHIKRLADKYAPDETKGKDVGSKVTRSILETRESIDKWLKEDKTTES